MGFPAGSPTDQDAYQELPKREADPGETWGSGQLTINQDLGTRPNLAETRGLNPEHRVAHFPAYRPELCRQLPIQIAPSPSLRLGRSGSLQ